jgi:hypothetical protein
LSQLYWIQRREEKVALKQQLLITVASLLKPLGFSRSGKTLYRKMANGNLVLVHFQFLSRQDIAEVRPSIGVASARLAKLLKPNNKRQSLEIHLGAFIRYLGAEIIDFPKRGGGDSVFELRSDEEVENVARQISHFMIARGINWLEENAADERIVAKLKDAKGIQSDWAAMLEREMNGAV